MGKTIVVYKSDKGHTKKYSEYIAEKTNAEIIDIKNIKSVDFSIYDNIVLAGCVYAGHIKGAKEFNEIALKYSNKNLIVIAVGMTLPTEKEFWEKTTDLNYNDIIKSKGMFFALTGGIEIESLGFLPKKMIGMMAKGLRAKQDKTQNDQFMLDCVDGKVTMDVTDADPVVEYINKI